MRDSTPLQLRQRGPLMNTFYDHHRDSIRWHYRCFDRTVGADVRANLPLSSVLRAGLP
jgi:hypothetical protein